MDKHKVAKTTLQLSRRDMGWLTGAGLVGLFFNPVMPRIAASDDKTFEVYHRFPRMMQEYLLDKVRAAAQVSHQSKEAIQSKQEALDYIRTVREKIAQCFGPMPEKMPLNPRITGSFERDAYRVENVIFDSRPDFPVTANLYIPKNAKGPMPAVVGTCGHSSNGKAYEGYQSFAQGLARLGFVVLLYDPISQGERLQYVDENLKSTIGVGVREHLYAGNQQFLVGEFFGTWRAWDGIRALDYLLTRKEVDPSRVGVTGNSGGGTMTTWLCGLESRWSMAAPSCFVTEFLRNFENELPADTEQCPPKALALGLDHEDFIAAMAPKPVILLGKEKDFFDIRGTETAHGRLKKLYQHLGNGDHVSIFAGPTTHGYSEENRVAMYRWFNQHAEVADRNPEPEIVIEKDETLWCTPKGQVADLKPRTVFSFTKEISQKLLKKRGYPKGEELHSAIKSVLRLPEIDPNPPYRILRPKRSRDYPASNISVYAVETEPKIQALVYRLSDESLSSRPPRGSKQATLYVSHLSSDDELRTEPLVRELASEQKSWPFFTCDVRGIGESLPNTCGDDFFSPYGNDYFYAVHSIMLDYPYVGQRTFDVLRVIEWLKSCGHSEIHLVAKGWGTLPATFAAVLSKTVKQVTLKNALTSYTDIAESENYDWPLSTLLLDVLKTFDVPDCYVELQAKNLNLIDFWGAQYRSQG